MARSSLRVKARYWGGAGFSEAGAGRGAFCAAVERFAAKRHTVSPTKRRTFELVRRSARRIDADWTRRKPQRFILLGEHWHASVAMGLAGKVKASPRVSSPEPRANGRKRRVPDMGMMNLW